MARELDAAIAERACKQLGLITIEQSRQLGMTDRMRQMRVRDGRLVVVGARTFRLAGAPDSWEQHLHAAVLEAGCPCAVSHLAAAALWGMPSISKHHAEVTTPRDRQPRRLRAVPIVHHRTRHFDDCDVTERTGLPVTTPARTLIDIAPRVTLRQLERCVDDAVRRRLTTLQMLGERHDALVAGRRGMRRLRQVLGSGVDYHSHLEREAVRVVTAAGLCMPELQAQVTVDGRRFYVDMLWRAAGLVVELDGHGSHATRQERQSDAEREALLVASGLRVVRFTYEDVMHRPRYVVATLARLLPGFLGGTAS